MHRLNPEMARIVRVNPPFQGNCVKAFLLQQVVECLIEEARSDQKPED